MSQSSTQMLSLVPALYRGRDATVDGAPLAKLLAVIGGELDQLQHAIGSLLDDHFPERASPEALFQLAELLGARLLGADARTNRVVVARSVHWSRRKGTLPTLEEMLAATSGWAVEVDEGYRSLRVAQHVRHPMPERGRSAVLWDPVALADPLSRRAPDVARPRLAHAPRRALELQLLDGETVDDALRRMGRADAGRYAASPRTADFRGWVRPETILVRAARMAVVEMEGVEPGRIRALPSGDLGLRLDPLDRDQPVAWLQPLERPDTISRLTDVHEPASEESESRTAAVLLTPTALAADADAAEEAGALQLSLDGVPLVGPPTVPRGAHPLQVAPIGHQPVLRFADPHRPGPGDTWRLELVAVPPDVRPDDDDNPVLATTTGRRGAIARVRVGTEASAIQPGATVVLRVTRRQGSGARRASGAWAPLALDSAPAGAPRSAVAVVARGPGTRVTRALSAPDGTALTWFDPLDASPQWSDPVVPSGDLLPDAERLGVAVHDRKVFFVGPAGEGKPGIWQVEKVGGSPACARWDDPSTSVRLPADVQDPAVEAHQDRLYVFGGAAHGAPTAELWSIPLAGGPWKPTYVRNRQYRAGATLLSTPAGLAMLGGHSTAGHLDLTVWLCRDPTRRRPRWDRLPDLPFEHGRPGALVARSDGDGLRVTVWADRTQPQHLTLQPGDSAWMDEGSDADAPNPPAPGEAVFAKGGLVLAGPSPLPPSEVVFTLGGTGHLAFLPQLDLAVGEQAILEVTADGGCAHYSPPGELPPIDTRPGGPLYLDTASRVPDTFRLGQSGRLARHLFSLRQRSLGPWRELVPPVAGNRTVVGFDPRLGRVLLPHGVMPGTPRARRRIRVTASWRVGRGSLLGSGCLPADRAIPSWWDDAEHPARVPPDLERHAPAPVSAYLSSIRSGTSVTRAGVSSPVLAEIDDEAMNIAKGVDHPVFAALGSARLPPVRLPTGSRRASLVALDFGATPFIDANPDGVSVFATALPDDGATSPEVWLAGLWLRGRAELVLTDGAADLRWCTLGIPGALALRVAGGGHQGPPARRTLPPADVELRLYGCQLGVVSVPPWVRLVAAGCLFDAGTDDEVAIAAAGARVVLRHCTVRGRTLAGELRASSSALSGVARCDRPDLGWLRYCALRPGGLAPVRHRCIEQPLAFASTRPTLPTYLVLAPNNGPDLLRAGEHGRVPGAHGDRSDRARELVERSHDFIAMGTTPVHLDRVALDLNRMRRRLRT